MKLQMDRDADAKMDRKKKERDDKMVNRRTSGLMERERACLGPPAVP